jgi:hypothetical protein
MDDHLGSMKGSDGMQWIDSPASASHTHLRALGRREWGLTALARCSCSSSAVSTHIAKRTSISNQHRLRGTKDRVANEQSSQVTGDEPTPLNKR